MDSHPTPSEAASSSNFPIPTQAASSPQAPTPPAATMAAPAPAPIPGLAPEDYTGPTPERPWTQIHSMNPLRGIALEDMDRYDAERATDDQPPAYHTVVDPNAPIPGREAEDGPDAEFPFINSSQYESEPGSHSEDDDEEDEDTTNIVVNAQHNVRGNCNIIDATHPGIDAVSIGSTIAAILRNSGAAAPGTNLNITINCGANIVGHRNIYGTDLKQIVECMAAYRAKVAAQQAQQQQQDHVIDPVPPNPQAGPGRMPFQSLVTPEGIKAGAGVGGTTQAGAGATPPSTPDRQRRVSFVEMKVTPSKRPRSDDDEKEGKRVFTG